MRVRSEKIYDGKEENKQGDICYRRAFLCLNEERNKSFDANKNIGYRKGSIIFKERAKETKIRYYKKIK